jgi:hypothetical protein
MLAITVMLTITVTLIDKTRHYSNNFPTFHATRALLWCYHVSTRAHTYGGTRRRELHGKQGPGAAKGESTTLCLLPDPILRTVRLRFPHMRFVVLSLALFRLWA